MANVLAGLAAGIGICLVVGIVALAAWQLVDDHRQGRETREAVRDAEEFIDDLERVHGRAFRTQE